MANQNTTVDKTRLGSVAKMMNRMVEPFGYAITPARRMVDYYLHEYTSYEEYRDVQILHNKRKIDRVFADEATMRRVAEIALTGKDGQPVTGLCHGTRNGFEQNFLNGLGQNISAIGTDISETANDYENSIHWDFHDVNPDWLGTNDFVYTNSLDQSWKPKDALTTWLGQLKDDGVLIIEHTDAHSPTNASEMDPFGVRPVAMPYVLTMWFGHQITLSHSVARKANDDQDAWLFAIRKTVPEVRPLDGDL